MSLLSAIPMVGFVARMAYGLWKGNEEDTYISRLPPLDQVTMKRAQELVNSMGLTSYEIQFVKDSTLAQGWF
ncbi:MAG: hypothetical protein JSR46_05380 [Verrucomicrobia bacterium]|nr:hypothetical protein [Verrucomicrobiota bacterium]